METKSSQARKVVRVVARVKPSTDPVGAKSITVHKPNGDESETVSISFGAQFAGSKDSYKVDYCYEENESLNYEKEIKPLVISVFDGKDANVIAHGSRSSGKTYLLQGCENEFGLVVVTMGEMLSLAEERGGSVFVSVYEVSQETVYDILHQEKRVVSVLEGGLGKIQLKGLSKVPVKSLSDFQNLYFGLKKSQKLSHRGVMIHVTTGSGPRGRMNFLDMAGYEDSRKQSSDLAPLEIARVNKTIYALQNVMYALNANESHVPYRESKLTRMLKDCLGGGNRTLLITCLPREFSQDSFYMLNLASRICVGSNRVMSTTTKKTSSVARCTSSSSVVQRRQTPLVVSTTSKKTFLRGSVTERKTKLTTTATSAIKGRKLFTEATDSVNSKKNLKKIESKARMTVKKEISSSKVISTSKVVMNVQASSSEEGVCSSFVVTDSQSSLVEEDNLNLSFSSSTVSMEPVAMEPIHSPSVMEPVNSPSTNSLHLTQEYSTRASCQEDLTLVNEGENLDKENKSLLVNEAASPPLSIRLQELSNTLKSICKPSSQSSAPEKFHTALTKSKTEEVPEYSDVTAETVELRTPERSTAPNIEYSPWKTFSAHSTKLKNSAVGEYLKFLNTADKEDLKKLKGIGERRATYIVELREESPEPFKKLDDLKDIGLSEKQIKGLLRKEIGDIFQ